MRAGKLNCVVDIQRAVVSRGESGSEAETYAAILTNEPCEFEILAGSERFAAQQLQSLYDVMVKIRFHPGVDEHCRVKRDGKYYDIVAIIDVLGKRRELKLMCRTKPDAE